MKTIKINGVEFRITRETSDTTVDQHYRFSVEPSGGSFSVRQIIDAAAPGVEVSISGHPDAVKGLFVAPSDPHSLIQRALSALGYVVGDHEKDVAQFSQWIDHLAKFPQSEEALELWTKATLARLHATRSVDEASKDAQSVVIQRMRLFPPAPKTGLDDGPLLLEPWAELHEWRSAAKRCGIESAKELAGTVAETFGQFVDRKVTRDWQEATGCKTPEDASKLDELAKTWQDSSTRYEYIAKQRAREISEWAAKSGVASPDALVEKFRVTEDAWKEATGAVDTHAAYKKIADLESKILSYASEIDALRKLASPKRDWDAELGLAGAEHRMRVAAERELAKIKAELDSKRRECQTEKERADKAEHDANNLRVIYSDARASAGLPLQIGEGENLSKWCSDAREKLSRAIIPLPKPEKVEAGQKWAFVMKAIEKGSSPPRVVGTFIDSNGSSWCAYQSDLDTGFYLGT